MAYVLLRERPQIVGAERLVVRDDVLAFCKATGRLGFAQYLIFDQRFDHV